MSSDTFSDIVNELKKVNNNLHIANTLLVEQNLIMHHIALDDWNHDHFENTISHQLSNHIFHKKKKTNEPHISDMKKELQELGIISDKHELSNN